MTNLKQTFIIYMYNIYFLIFLFMKKYESIKEFLEELEQGAPDHWEPLEWFAHLWESHHADFLPSEVGFHCVQNKLIAYFHTTEGVAEIREISVQELCKALESEKDFQLLIKNLEISIGQ